MRNITKLSYKADLRNLDWKDVTQESNIGVGYFQKPIEAGHRQTCPINKEKSAWIFISFVSRDSSWLTNEIKTKAHERDYYLRKARKSGKEIDWQRFAVLEMM